MDFIYQLCKFAKTFPNCCIIAQEHTATMHKLPGGVGAFLLLTDLFQIGLIGLSFKEFFIDIVRPSPRFGKLLLMLFLYSMHGDS